MQQFLKGCLASVVTMLLIVLAFAGGFLANAYRTGVTTTAFATPPDGAATISEPPANFGVFFEALGLMRSEFYGDVPSEAQLNYAAIRGVLDRLDDPNTILVEPEIHEREREQFQGEFGGIGAQVSTDEAGHIVIVAPIDGTPAARADLRANDIILEVDGEPITGMPLDQAVELIRGPVGTEVRLLIQRPGDEEAFEVTIVRDKIPDPTVHHAMVEGEEGVGYIRVAFFSARTTDELRDAIEALQAEGATRFILDLRNNPGGLLDTAIGTASLFVGDSTIAYQQFNDGRREALAARGTPLVPDAPLVVLINEGSASASEILAGALQATGRATLVGTPSYGKGTVQIPYTLDDGSSLHVTIAHWLTPDGIDLSEEGLEPEVYVELSDEDREAGQDTVFNRALEIVKEAN